MPILGIMLGNFNTTIFFVLSFQLILFSTIDVICFIRNKGHSNQIILFIKIALYFCYLLFSFLNESTTDFFACIDLHPSLATLAILISTDRIAGVCKEMYLTGLKLASKSKAS